MYYEQQGHRYNLSIQSLHSPIIFVRQLLADVSKVSFLFKNYDIETSTTKCRAYGV